MSELVSNVSPKGQVTIPIAVRRLLGLKPKDRVVFTIHDGRVQLAPVKTSLDGLCRSIPALERPLTDQEMVNIATEEHARQVAREDEDSSVQ